MIRYLESIAEQSPSGAVDEALRVGVWTPGSSWHCVEVLIAAAKLATDVNEYRLAGLAAYQAQRLQLAASGTEDQWGLPVLPGLEVAARQFNLVRYIPLVSRNVQLRRPRLSDREFLLQMFCDPDFRRRYSQPVFGREAHRVHRIIERDGRAPLEDSAWAWIIADLDDQPLGLVEFTELDFRLGNVDLAMGLRDPSFSTVAFEAFCLGLSLAFHHLGVRRVTGHVYDDNALSSRLHAHMGSVREFSMDGLVTDPETARTLPMTIYSMTPDEARASPWLARLNRFLPASTPDLLRDSIDQIAGEILALGPRWRSTRPRVPPRVPEPPAAKSNMSATPMPLPPEHLAGRRVVLRPIGPSDRDTFALWLDTPGFIKASPAGIDAETGIDGLGALLGGEPGNVLLWLVEEQGSQRQLGCIGVKIENRLPVLIGLAGFARNANRFHVIESWRLVRKALFSCYPEARLYLKLPPYSDWQPWIESYRAFQNCGLERNQRCIGCAEGADLIVLGYEVRARRD